MATTTKRHDGWYENATANLAGAMKHIDRALAHLAHAKRILAERPVPAHHFTLTVAGA